MDKQTFSSRCRADGSITINSGERLTIQNAVDFAQCIREALATSQRVTVEFDDNIEADVTTLQILCSACKTAWAAGKILTHQGHGAESLRQLIISAGAERPDPCAHINSNSCLWFGVKP